MKRHGNLFEQTFIREALFDAYVEARRGKRLRKACFWFDIRAGAVLDWLHRRLHDGSYEVRGYKRFLVHEPKTREICAPWFGGIVVQHAAGYTIPCDIAVSHWDEGGRRLVMGIFRDASERVRAEEALRRVAAMKARGEGYGVRTLQG